MGGEKFGRSMRLEGKNEGHLEQARVAIVRVLRKRYGSKSLREIESALANVISLDVLNDRLDRAVRCRSITKFSKELPAPLDAADAATPGIEPPITATTRLADTLSVLNLFGEMAYPRLDVAAIIGKEKLRESKFGRTMRLEGKHEGHLEQARVAIVRVLRKRFPSETLQDIESALVRVDRLDVLDAVLDHAVDCRTLAKFRAKRPAPARQQ